MVGGTPVMKLAAGLGTMIGLQAATIATSKILNKNNKNENNNLSR
jgi:hypothetical protein